MSSTASSLQDEGSPFDEPKASESITYIESLQVLAARATGRYLRQTEKEIPRRADDAISERRAELNRQLDELDKEKIQDIKKRTEQLEIMRAHALEQFCDVVGSPGDSYCTKCKDFYKKREKSTNLCSIDGCLSHTRCPVCENRRDRCREAIEEGSDYCSVDEDLSITEVEIITEAKDHPSKTGFLDCWICKESFCNLDFFKHYGTCRAKASRRCGFQPPYVSNESKGYACVPGHCGRELNSEQDQIFVCAPGGFCCTVCCEDCVSFCHSTFYDEWSCQPKRCREARCKPCSMNNVCYGPCNGR